MHQHPCAVRFTCCSLIASTSAATPQLHPLQLIAFTSAAAPWLRLFVIMHQCSPTPQTSHFHNTLTQLKFYILIAEYLPCRRSIKPRFKGLYWWLLSKGSNPSVKVKGGSLFLLSFLSIHHLLGSPQFSILQVVKKLDWGFGIGVTTVRIVYWGTGNLPMYFS